MKRILLFKVGRVQDYILESKKVSDLVESSKLISNLVKNMINRIIDKYNGEVLLPCYDDSHHKSSQYNITNSILIYYEEQESIGNKLEQFCYDYLEKAIELLINKYSIIKDKIINHLHSIIEIDWVECEVEDLNVINSSQYDEIYKSLTYYLKALKYSKKYYDYPERGRKCSLCGKRNVIFYSGKKPYDIESPYIKLENKDKKYLKENESLCGACFLKRQLASKDSHKSKSLAEICLTNWISVNKNKEEYHSLQTMIKDISSKYGEYELMIKDCLINELDDTRKTNEAKKIFEVFQGTQEKYYCIYRMDIDDLGKWLSGKYKNSKENLYSYQKDISNIINQFMEVVSDEIRQISGSQLVYAGGDDILALMPVRQGIDFSLKINELFHEKIRDKEEYKDLTFSQGVFITHYRDTLKESLKLSKERLESLKLILKNSNSIKNGFLISILTDGYYYKEFYLRNTLDNEYAPEIINDLRAYFLKYSTYFTRELQASLKNICHSEIENNKLEKLLFAQQKYYLKRSFIDEKQLDKNKIQGIVIKLEKILFNMTNFLNIKEAIDNYFNMLFIIEKISIILGEDRQNEYLTD